MWITRHLTKKHVKSLLKMLNITPLFFPVMKHIFISQDAINEQNFRYWWSYENPWELHQWPLHNGHGTMWCAVSNIEIINHIFWRQQSYCNNKFNSIHDYAAWFFTTKIDWVWKSASLVPARLLPPSIRLHECSAEFFFLAVYFI